MKWEIKGYLHSNYEDIEKVIIEWQGKGVELTSVQLIKEEEPK